MPNSFSISKDTVLIKMQQRLNTIFTALVRAVNSAEIVKAEAVVWRCSVKKMF